MSEDLHKERKPAGRVRFVGFDKDGTLFDTMPSYARIWGEIMHRDYGIDEQKASDFLSETSGQQTNDQVKNLLSQNGIAILNEDAIKKGREVGLELGEKVQAKLFPEVVEILRQLKKHGYMIFVSSGQQEEVIEKDLKDSGIAEYIDFYAGARPDDPEYKKGPAHFQAAAKHFGVPLEQFVKETIFIGDTPSDMRAALDSNIISIIRRSANADESLLKEGASFFVEDFSKLPEIIASIN